MGQKSSARRKKKFRTTKKALKTNGFQGVDGGDKRDRTADLLNAIQALSQAIPLLTPKVQCLLAIDCTKRFLFHFSHFQQSSVCWFGQEIALR